VSSSIDTIKDLVAMLNNNMDAFYENAYNEGAKYVLQYLADVFEGVEDTDVWTDFFGESEEGNDETLY